MISTISPTGSPTKSPTPEPTLAPTPLVVTPEPTKAPVLLPIKISPASDKPYSKCVGNCADDSDCADGLVCYERRDMEEVPGCTGNGSPPDQNGFGYCVVRLYDFLWIVGDELEPPEAFPLGICEGDCDGDEECEEGLKCFDRGANEPVPGCDGDGYRKKDYCYCETDCGTKAPSKSPTPSPTQAPTTAAPTKAPMPEPTTSPSKSPTSSPTQAPSTAAPTTSPVPEPTTSPMISTISPTGSPTKSPTPEPTLAPTPLVVTPEPTKAPVLLPIKISPASDKPYSKCVGNCADDSDCADGLVCYERRDMEEVPGCTGNGSPPDQNGFGYCVVRLYDFLWIVGDELEPPEAFPLGICEGDCDGDEECEEGLKCFDRGANEPVPGCDGDGYRKKDYCYCETDCETSSPTLPQPSKSPVPPTPPPTRSPFSGTAAPVVPPSYYKYTSGSRSCSWQGPEPLDNKSNVALQFWTFGDVPYDGSSDGNTCLSSSGSKQDPCKRYNCVNNDSLPRGNTCTYEGEDYECVKEQIIPYINAAIDDGNGAFAAHYGDILSELLIFTESSILLSIILSRFTFLFPLF